MVIVAGEYPASVYITVFACWVGAGEAVDAKVGVGVGVRMGAIDSLAFLKINQAATATTTTTKEMTVPFVMMLILI